MATYIGKSGALSVTTTVEGSPVTRTIAEIKDWSIEATSEVVATTVMGDEWVKNKTTQKSWTASFNAFWDKADLGQGDLSVGSEVTLNVYPEGNTTSLTEITGKCLITSVSKSASFDGLVEASFSATGTEALTEGTV